MGMIKSAPEINTLAEAVPNSGGVYFVTAFAGLLAPYWDTSAGGMLIGTPSPFPPPFTSSPSLTEMHRSDAVYEPLTHRPRNARGRIVHDARRHRGDEGRFGC